jgi:hypothetical protein
VNYGQTWTKITNGIAENDFTRVIREDPARRGLLYAGTETAILVSFDDGEHWQSLRRNLPVVPIHDLAVKDTDLIAATHGRSFWILDDITPLRQVNTEIQDLPAYLFTPRPTARFKTNYGFARSPESGKYYRSTGTTMITARVEQQPDGKKVERNLDAGNNPPNGVIIGYYLKEKPEGEVKLTFLDAQGQEIHSFSSKVEKEAPDTAEPPTFTDPPADTDETLDTLEEEQESGEKGPPIPKEVGANRFIWNMRYPDAKRVQGYVASEATLAGPLVPPGVYRVQLTVGDESLVESFEIRKDPRIPATQSDLEAQFDLRMKIHNKLSQTHDAINMLRSIRRQVEDWEQRTQEQQDHEAIVRLGRAIKEKLFPVEDELIQFKAKSRQDTLNHPAKLNAKLASLGGTVSSADAAPTRQEYELFEDLVARIDVQLQRLQEIIDTDVKAFNDRVHESGIPAIIPIATLPK